MAALAWKKYVTLTLIIMSPIIISPQSIMAVNTDADRDSKSDSKDIDVDQDGYPDCWEKSKYLLDHDNDATPDTDDTDDDNDGIADKSESSTDARYDANNDEVPDTKDNRLLANNDNDADKDGILDRIEKDSYKNNSDNDEKKNDDDKDDDQDGLKDKYEDGKKKINTDNDGVNNRVDEDLDGDGINDWNENSCTAIYNYDCPTCVADIAIYDTPLSDQRDGGWEEEVEAFQAMAQDYGWTIQTVSMDELNSGVLGSGNDKKYKVFIAPGGWSPIRDRKMTAWGEQYLRDYVNSGGGYVGFCGGAYLASDTVIFADGASGGGGTYSTESDYGEPFEYDLNLLSGSAKGAFAWLPYEGLENSSMDPATINKDNAVMASVKMTNQAFFFYGGGPYFTNFSEEPTGYNVWARAKKPVGAPDGATAGDGEAAVIQYNYGAGRVVLSAYHPAFLLNSSVDGVTESIYYDEDEVIRYADSPAQDIMNLYSWNIAHAAVQYAMHEKITAITELPN